METTFLVQKKYLKNQTSRVVLKRPLEHALIKDRDTRTVTLMHRATSELMGHDYTLINLNTLTKMHNYYFNLFFFNLLNVFVIGIAER